MQIQGIKLTKTVSEARLGVQVVPKECALV